MVVCGVVPTLQPVFIGGETLGRVATKDEEWFATEESGIGRGCEGVAEEGVAEAERVEVGRRMK